MDSCDPYSNRVRDYAQRIQENGAVALSGLFDLTSGRLLRYAVNITRNQHDAEDALQATLLDVASKPERLATADKPWPYLLQIVRNQSLLILRKKKRAFYFANLCDLLTQRTADPIEKQESNRAIWKALRKLPLEQREVVVLKIWEEMTFAQIAEILEVTPSTAASRYRYAMEKLTRMLQVGSAEVAHE